MVRLFMLLFAVELVLVILALISCLSAERGDVRTLPRIGWVTIIVLIPLVGPVMYLLAGRPLPATPERNPRRPGTGFPEPKRPGREVAPDDDPDFLRNLDRQRRTADEKLMRQWEEDLRRRENEVRKPEETPPTDS